MSDIFRNRFAKAPINIDKIQRSIFDRTTQHKTTFNAGDLIPIYVDEVLPGDTFKMETSFVVREQTLIHPVMDNAYLDIFYFYVPNRIIWDHWKNFMGENTDSEWIPSTTYSVPRLSNPANGWSIGTLADYFGIPLVIEASNSFSVNALPFRAYCLIWNEWFRDQNLQKPTFWSKGDETISGSNGVNYITDPVKGGMPLKAGKYHDYFTSALPSPQKGNPVTLPSLGGVQPVLGSKDDWSDTILSTGSNLRFREIGASASPNEINYSTYVRRASNANSGVFMGSQGYEPPIDKRVLIPANLSVDLSKISSISVNDLRYAFAVQKMLEKDARGGTRYTEVIKTHFGVSSADSRQQRPEYLGGLHHPISTTQVPQTSATDKSVSPQANMSAYSLTTDSRASFTKSFTEHGWVIGLAVVRTEHTYQQGLERFWSRKTRYDFYDPTFANIGEQPIYNREIYLTGKSTDKAIFGYNEAWADYRYKPSRVSSTMRSAPQSEQFGSLDVWHYADSYSDLPKLSAGWISETTANIDRTIAVQSTKEKQFIADFLFKNYCARPMPMYSVPGMIDRN